MHHTPADEYEISAGKYDDCIGVTGDSIVLRSLPSERPMVQMYVERGRVFTPMCGIKSDGVPIETVRDLLDKAQGKLTDDEVRVRICDLLAKLGCPPEGGDILHIEHAVKKLANTKGLLIKCRKCGKQLTKQSPIVLTSPSVAGHCMKLHYCCWRCVKTDEDLQDPQGHWVGGNALD